MKVLRIQTTGVPLFDKPFDVSFLATQRISEDEKGTLYSLFSNIYINPTEAIIGINASGKTSSLKMILFVLHLLNNEPINHIHVNDILGDTKNAVLTIYFYTNRKEICKLETTIAKVGDKYKIKDEYLWKKYETAVKFKKKIFDFDDSMLVAKRDENEEYLSDDVSIVIAQNKKNKDGLDISDMLSFTNMNILPMTRDIPLPIISFLDPSVEKLYFEENDSIIHLKFYNQEEIILNNARELEKYLSSGTIKGIIIFMHVIQVLEHGGYMIVDEIENHFNREIVSTLIRFFMDIQLNKQGAVLIFTTHYPELLDEYDRNDSIFITRNRNGLEIENLSCILKRNDIKKSDAYQSGYLEGTTPAYEAYIQLKKKIAESV